MGFGARVFGAAAAVALATSQASAVCPAGSIVVSPGFAGAINAGIAAAGAGGTVCLNPGVYEEGATVNINKPLTLIGDGATPGETVIDAFGVSPGIQVSNQNGVRIENLTVQQASGDNIQVTGNSFTATNIISRGGTDDCLEISGNGPTVSDSSFLGCFFGTGIGVSGSTGPTLTNNTVRGTSLGINAGSGINAQVTGNRVQNTTTAIAGSGNNSQYNTNEITNAVVGMNILSDGAVFDGNTLQGVTGFFGLSIAGANPRVSNNSVEDSLGGFLINCMSVCDQGFVTGNTAFGTGPSGAFNIIASSNSYRIEDNQAADSLRDGFTLDVLNASVSGNNVGRMRTGYVVSNQGGNAITDNIARTSAGSGFLVNSASNTLTGNEARKNVRDGFTLVGNSNKLVDGRSVRNRGEGIDVDGTTVRVTNTVSQNNRIDCAANTALDPASSGNTCGDGSNFAVPSEIDDGI